MLLVSWLLEFGVLRQARAFPRKRVTQLRGLGWCRQATGGDDRGRMLVVSAVAVLVPHREEGARDDVTGRFLTCSSQL